MNMLRVDFFIVLIKSYIHNNIVTVNTLLTHHYSHFKMVKKWINIAVNCYLKVMSLTINLKAYL